MSSPRPAISRLDGSVGVPTADFSHSLEQIQNQLVALPEFYAREDLLPRLLRGYFREARIQASLGFAQTSLVVEDSPDLQVRAGAGICAEARIHDGMLSFPQPLRLSGFHALGGFYDFCSVDTNPAGKILLQSCACSLPKESDITEPVLKGPLSRLFPEKKVQAIPTADLLLSLNPPQPSATEPSGDDPLLSALRSLQLKAQIPSELWVDDPPGTPGGSCHPLTASLEAYFDIPGIRKNLAEGLWRSFDFSGLERGSKLLWPRFDLAQIPLPEGWSISEGRADLELRYFPEEGITEIQVRHLKARARISPAFGNSELNIEGGAKLILRRGGEIELELKDLRVELPLHSAPNSSLPNFSALLNGQVGLTIRKGQTELSKLHLSLNDLQLQVPESSPSPLGSSGLAWQGTLLGQAELEYEGGNKQWTRLETNLSGDLSVLNQDGSVLLKAEGVGIEVTGDETQLSLSGDALSVNYGAIALRPAISAKLRPQFTKGVLRLEGDGSLALAGLNIPLALSSGVKMGASSTEGRIQFTPLALSYGGKNWSEKGKLEGHWDAKGLSAQLSLPDLPDGTALDLRLRRRGDSERLSGDFKVRPPKQNLAAGLSADNLNLSGSFITDAWSTLLAKPRVSLTSQLSGDLAGDISGPFRAELEGSLSYSPERRSIFLWLNPRRNSALHLGPLNFSGEPRLVEADLPLKGTWQAVLLPRGVLLGGRGVGAAGGEIRVQDGASQKKLVEGFDLVADQLWSVQNGVAYAGGDGIRLEAQVEPSAWLGSTVQGLGRRKVFLVTDQMPLSLDAYWKLFAQSLNSEGKH